MINKILTSLENFALWVSCIALLAMGAIVSVSVVGRVLFNSPVPDDLLVVGLLMVCVILLPLAYIERQDGHIVVTVISGLMPLKFQHFLSAIGKVLFGLFLGTMGVMIALKVPEEFSQELYYDGQLEVATWPMKIVFAFGVMVFLVRLMVRAWGSLLIAFGVRPETPLGTETGHET